MSEHPATTAYRNAWQVAKSAAESRLRRSEALRINPNASKDDLLGALSLVRQAQTAQEIASEIKIRAIEQGYGW